MFTHSKALMTPVEVTTPDPRFAQFMLEQFGGATGELTAALQYWVQSFHVEDAAIRDMLQDIAVEEFSHLEVVGMLIQQHSAGAVEEQAWRSTLFAVRGMGPHLLDSCGSAWTAAYVNEGGNVVRDLRANIGAEGGARQTYEALMKMAPDEGTLRALHFLYTREVTHTQMFMRALDSLGKLDVPLFGNVPPDGTVDIYFNLSKLGGEDEAEPGPALVGEGMRITGQPGSLTLLGEAPAFVNPDDEKPGASPGMAELAPG
ncbi:manganese catalase family protein [Sediminicoccus sp. BL-A-41-H5]|uniref:manganese catalase family protein n=1 Tax=Sediminicoccus sp. BL-A-41-H5 TaxID=3421106 RepID=UPI003D67C675